MKKERKSIFESKLLSSKIKSTNVKLFPEAFLGYFGGPFFALIPNAIMNTFLTQYWKNVLGLESWASVFLWLMPLLSSILIVVGNLLVGKLMEGKPKKAGKARPLIFLSVPLIAIALVAIFLAPYPYTGTVLNDNVTMWTLIITAVGYNLFYAFAWPMYYTSHSSMVSLSTRNGNQRGLLATLCNAAQVGAAGIAGMAGGYLTTLFQLVPSEKDQAYWTNILYNPDGTIKSYDIDQDALLNARQGANGRWMIVLIILVSVLLLGCLLEYFFTRERVTEEKVAELEANSNADDKKEVKKVSMLDQIKVCVHDKNWWLIIIFFLLYQLGGMLKNNGQNFYSEAWTGNLNMSSTIGIAGAIPTALGMLAIWPIANKFGKANSIKIGAVFAAVFGLVGFIPLFVPSLLNGTAETIAGPINGIAIGGFVTKALGTVPAMYISLALLADVLDHQEAVYGIRTDGFTMAVYGSIMIAMTGIANAIILGVSSSFAPTDLVGPRIAMTTLFFGGEVLAYLAIALMFIFLKVEKYSKFDQEILRNRQKEACLAQGIEYIDPETKAKQEALQQEKEAEEAFVNKLKAKCAKKHLDFEAELAKHNKKVEEKKAKQLSKENAIKAKEEARLAKLTPEAKAKLEAKEAALRAEYEEILRKATKVAH